MANMLLNIAGAFINQANTGDVKGAVVSRGQANAHTRNVKADNRAEKKRERERESEREKETITKFFRSRGPFLPSLATLHVPPQKGLFPSRPLSRRRSFTCPLIATVRHFSLARECSSPENRRSKWTLS